MTQQLNDNATRADLIVIGAGPGGYDTAAEAAAEGREVILIERSFLGGTCLNRGCIPTKALCHSAREFMTVREAVPDYQLDYGRVAERKDRIVAELRDGVKMLLSKVKVVEGDAVFEAADLIRVGTDLYTAPQIIVATGSRPAKLNIEGADLTITSDELLALEQLPESVAIIGGGVIGMEFASIFNAFGVDVTVIEYCPEILPPFDAEIAKRLRMALKRRGIKILTSTEVKSVEPGIVRCIAKNKDVVVEAATIVMAVGRKPVIPDGLAQCGIEIDRRGVVVGPDMATSVPGVYAVGDVTGRCMLAHYAAAQGRVALGIPQLLDPVPSAVFTYPECAMVGLTEQQCRDKEMNINIGKATFRSNGKALAEGEPDGMVKAIVDADTLRLLGVHICGPHASDLVQTACTAISAGIPADEFTRTIFAHPTISETLKAAVAAALH